MKQLVSGVLSLVPKCEEPGAPGNCATADPAEAKQAAEKLTEWSEVPENHCAGVKTPPHIIGFIGATEVAP